MHRANLALFLMFVFQVGPGFGVPVQSGTKRPVNLLINGSFEEGLETGKWRSLNPGSTAIKGWTVTRGQIDYVGALWNALDGSRSIDLHGSPGFGGISQDFATQKGKAYSVTVFLAGTPGSGMRKVGVHAAGASTEFHCDGNKSIYAKMAWAMYTWEFTAIADKTTLEIHTLDTTDPTRGAVVDHVSVVLKE